MQEFLQFAAFLLCDLEVITESDKHTRVVIDQIADQQDGVQCVLCVVAGEAAVGVVEFG
ncbi:hypothetical protein ABLE92_20465 [Gordonia sp. VNQ95]|uniref:hypothetical protein n=1 Tax=Gordonia sp. VNQ95 TaxID=3156619 RepID=UPI0032B54378